MMTIEWTNDKFRCVAIRTDDTDLLAWIVHCGGWGIIEGDLYFFHIPRSYNNVMGHLRCSYHVYEAIRHKPGGLVVGSTGSTCLPDQVAGHVQTGAPTRRWLTPHAWET